MGAAFGGVSEHTGAVALCCIESSCRPTGGAAAGGDSA